MRSLIVGLILIALLSACGFNSGIGGSSFVEQVATPTAEALRFPVEVIRAPTSTPAPTPTAVPTPTPTPRPIVRGPQTVIVFTELYGQTVAITVHGFVAGDDANVLIKNAMGPIAHVFEEPGQGEMYFLVHFSVALVDGPPGQTLIVDNIRNFHVSQVTGVPAGFFVVPESLRFPDLLIKRGQSSEGWVGGIINENALGVLITYQHSRLDPLTYFTFNCLNVDFPNVTNLCF